MLPLPLLSRLRRALVGPQARAPGLACAAGALALVAGALLGASRAAALEAWDGRIQAHGFFEMQVRGIDRNFSENLDLTQWYNIFDLELEADLLRDFGPIDQLDFVMRAEVRYDCVWTRACGMFPSANAFGDRARKLPKRLSNSTEVDTAGSIFLGNQIVDSPRQKPVDLSQVRGFNISATAAPASFAYTFENFRDFRFTQIQDISGVGFDRGNEILGPWLPKNVVHGNAGLADRINPFDASSLTPPMAAAGAVSGGGTRPFRPIPVQDPGQLYAKGVAARGLYMPSATLRRAIANDEFSDIGHAFNFTQDQRSWNHGLSQQQTKELKEAYLEADMFEGRLWLRIGRQDIVWGKTELFRTTDQLNPQDLALSSLPALEESRIPLWSIRAVYNLYDQPLPVEDLRFELAVNIDRYQANDLGTCGEPYTVNLVCQGVFGVFAHGLTGVGLVGIDNPPDPWKDLSGLELAGRVEWRWDRFSFALMDFWGYSDLPTIKRITTYERNVDPATGLPRIMGARGPCTFREPTGVGTDVAYQRIGADCLQPGPQFRAGANAAQVMADASLDPVTGAAVLNDQTRAAAPNNALDYHHANLTLFGFVCSQTVGVDPTGTDPAACAQTLFGSTAKPNPLVSFGEIISGVLAGNPVLQGLFVSGAKDGAGQPLIGMPVVQLNDDGPGSRQVVPGAAPGSPEGASINLPIFGPSLADLLTPEQEALLGCGPWWGTNCTQQGIDLLNADASALLQSWVGIEGTGPDPNYQIPYAGPLGAPLTPVGPPQPGHVGYNAAPICTTGNLRNDGRNDVLPGCRPIGSTGYAVNVDGGVANIGFIPTAQTVNLNPLIPFQGLGAQNPLHGQTFASEMAAVSWNFMMFTAATDSHFRNQNAFTPGVCSFVTPQYCPNVADFFKLVGVTRNTPRAGGNYQFGRRTFAWHGGGEVIITVPKRNVLGFSMDFAEDRTKSNWSMEFTWINKEPFFDYENFDNVSYGDSLNMTISADRPTFVNFLNNNRTLFFNTQWFFRYIPNWREGFGGHPWNILFTGTVTTGYFQDRLLPTLTGVYDVQSGSGALLSEIQYRYTEAFSLSLGVSVFMGHQGLQTMDVNPISPGQNQTGHNAYQVSTQEGLSVLRARDEIFLRLRYTF